MIYKNCVPSNQALRVKAISPSGFSGLRALDVQSDQSLNRPGGVFECVGHDKKIILFGEESPPAKIDGKEGEVFITLRRRRFPLPIFVNLLDVKMEKYSGTGIAKSYESHVRITPRKGKGITRETRISMNNPLRVDDFTFYQSGYSANGGLEASTLSVVKNSGRLFPYIASIIMGLGLLFECVNRMIKVKDSKSS